MPVDHTRPTRRSALIATAIYVALLVALCLRSTPRVTGDGAEYILLAERLARGQAPSVPVDAARAHGLFEPRLVDRMGAQQLWHFWGYSLLVAPVLRVSGSVASPPGSLPATAAFALVNIGLLGLAFGVTYRRVGPWAALFVGCSPILWWVDKAQVEVFTVSLVALGCALVARPHVAAIAFGLAATQNPPFTAISLLLVLVSVWRVTRAGRHARHERHQRHERQPHERRERLRIWLCCLIATLLSLLHPLFYLWRLGRWTPLVETADARIPGLRALLTIIVDLNVGMIVHAPIVVAALLLTGVAAVRAVRRRVPEAAARLALLGGLAALILIASAQAPNVNSGGTPGMSRYALWLVPLPLLVWPLIWSPNWSPNGLPLGGPNRLPIGRDARGAPGRRRSARLRWIVPMASAAWSLWLFQPSAPDNYLAPTPIASWLWSQHPTWENPLPEVFAERLRHKDGVNTLASTPDCAKVLVLDGQWPTPCQPRPLPDACRTPGALCYANRRGDGTYRFTVTSRRGGIRLSTLWP